MNPIFKNLALWLVISLVMITLFNLMTNRKDEPKAISYTAFLDAVEEGTVQEVMLEGSNIEGKDQDGAAFKTFAPNDPRLVEVLRTKGVTIQAKPEEDRGFWMTMLFYWGPIILFIGVWIFFIRQMQSGSGKAMSFGKSRARLLSESGNQVTFKDVAGIDEAKDELQEIVAFLKDPKKFSRLGGRIPKGVLLVGPPGTGKTLLGRAIAGEAGVPFFSISGSDFVEMFVGVGASRVRDLFMQGKKNAPCIIFIDEIDAVGRHRGAGLGGGHDEREQTLNQLLVEMDGFESNEGVILIAATNRPDVLDPALLRPGRFDRQVVVPRPDIKGRAMILDVHARKVPLDDDVNLDVVAKSTPGFSGADLANLINEAALLAARRDKEKVGMQDLEAAKDKVLMGAERRSLVITEKEKRVTAYHEAGHAVVPLFLPEADPVHKVSIIPRGRALGVTMFLPEEEKYNQSRVGLETAICGLLAGRVAEELVFGEMTSGASNDIERATHIARKMVCEWGMSDKIGPLAFGEKEGEVFLGRDLGHTRNYSESTAVEIDTEIRRIVQQSYDHARQILEENREGLVRVAEALLERETIDGEEVRSMILGEDAQAEPQSENESADDAPTVEV
ncbi:cell division ATP-dependent zinc protease FtsH [Syntrophotalea carbinolica DSM 2380]|uniref:ATP-dependent zinc metalloprotease FtsH n=1 Tax=Syntrophotalea carbinolica (strain DSM 2380 / NBRC 103641 / GraBd1) TaxID=338963 RepID=Q3A5V9_SYNC1|nr:ATP-dependent zinc metalloprotease FtsH [Syntrophotalea carbinolica]ABA88248.1 cell division ATP-dependent zinc protease FtsH [Syntrophotalea carbinolica DSM 2380]